MWTELLFCFVSCVLFILFSFLSLFLGSVCVCFCFLCFVLLRFVSLRLVLFWGWFGKVGLDLGFVLFCFAF